MHVYAHLGRTDSQSGRDVEEWGPNCGCTPPPRPASKGQRFNSRQTRKGEEKGKRNLAGK